ncbi:hypothetical protein PYW08_010387 [Mythimna loreyi]|uniref:Uncharacterized protein n=1 Tax=Mythimna loreyi TaxID=667449 RepID=A0ACC2Q6V6_9NEOP|nr:hypothetical protein PYW08_010387 [Mythimna loreyi]
MAKVQRTPPKTSTVSLTHTQTQSEPDINSAVSNSGFVNTSRYKRKANSPHGGPSYHTHKQDPSISELLAEQTASMAKLMSDVAEIKSQNLAIQKSNEEIIQSMSFLSLQFEDMKKEIEDLKRVRDAQQRHIDHLERKIIDQQVKSRISGVEIRNVPMGNAETVSSLSKTVIKICETLGTPINDSNIRDVYRLPGKSSNINSPRPIIAEFATVITKQNVVSAVRSFNQGRSKDQKLNTSHVGIPGKPQPIYIAEQLPLSARKLYHQTREFASKHSYKFCWVSNGNIFLRKQEGDKHILITSEQSFRELECK